MSNIHSVLNQRINKKTEQSSKMAAMAKQSASGHLTSFAGMFGVIELSEREKLQIESILREYVKEDDQLIDNDLKTLLSLTSEVKAINNQAALLHGERIKKAHDILTEYLDGAFTAWLIAAYGNRQTPYNLMQYYEFYTAMPKDLRPKIDVMPRQAVYSLATRNGNLDKKAEIVKNYKGESKIEVIKLIRLYFPLNENDKRKQKVSQNILLNLEKMSLQLSEQIHKISPRDRKRIRDLLYDLINQVK